jgi:hypothetical protein
VACGGEAAASIARTREVTIARKLSLARDGESLRFRTP